MPKAAILGSGWIAELHAKALHEAGIELWAIVSSRKERARAFAEKWNVPNYSTDFSLLYFPEIDCVHICTPPSRHGKAVRELLCRGKHILCEKPLSLDAKEAEELAFLAEEKGLLCAVGFNLRFYPACLKARELVRQKEFGRILLVHGSYLQEFGAEPAAYSWRYQDPLHAVSEIGSHWLDLAQFISGEKIIGLNALFDRFQPVRFQKDGMIYLRPEQDRSPIHVFSEDAAMLSLRFENGAIGSVALSELSHGRTNRLSIEITGEHQSLWWNSEDPQRLYLARKGERPESFFLDGSFDQTFVSEFQSFYRDIGRGCASEAALYADFRDGTHNALLCTAAQKSADENATWMEVLP